MSPDRNWRRVFRRELGWALVFKFVALALLWILFFSPSHRHHMDDESASRQFAIVGGNRD
jgi:hypothetical protein